MRNVLVAVFALALGIAVSVPVRALSINWADAPTPVPALAMVDRAGGPVTLDAFAGRVVVLNLWATWCAPCRLEMPSLAMLQERFDPADLLVVALAIDSAPWTALEAFMAEVGASNLLVLQDGSMASARALGAPGLPATLVIDATGAERFRHYGYADWAATDVIEALEALASGG